MYLVIQHHVEDFDHWRSAFDAHGTVRRKFGQVSEEVYQNDSSPTDVLVIMEFDTEANIHDFLADPGLKEVMDEAGVKSEPFVIISDRAQS